MAEGVKRIRGKDLRFWNKKLQEKFKEALTAVLPIIAIVLVLSFTIAPIIPSILLYPDVENKDGLKYIYFNTIGTKGGTESIKQLLSYLKHSKIENVTNEKISHIHDYVEAVKQSAEVRDRYMTIGEMLDASREEGKAEGKVEGEIIGRINSLLEILSEFGEIPEEIKKQFYEADEDTLKCWIKLAAKSSSLVEFVDKM